MNRVKQKHAVLTRARCLLIVAGLFAVPVAMTHAQGNVDVVPAESTANTTISLFTRLIVETTPLDFGTHRRPPGGAMVVTMLCDVSGAAFFSDAADIGGEATCGTITVTAPQDLSIQLSVNATSMAGTTSMASADGATLEPTYTVYNSDGTARADALASIPANGSELISDPISVTTSPSTFVLGGSVSLTSTTAFGEYAGSYTVVAMVE